MTDTAPPIRHTLTAPDGLRLAAYELAPPARSAGPPPRTVVMLHGLLFDSMQNWFTPGIAGAMTNAGLRVLALDWRAHGGSDAPTEAQFYPHDILAQDVETLIAAFSLRNYGLVGYSLGARMAARVMARGAKPRRLVLGGMGLSGLLHVADRQAHFEDGILNGPNAANPLAGALIQKFLKANGIAPGAALHVLRSQRDTPLAALAAIACPTLVVCGDRDDANGAAPELAAAIPAARLVQLPGEHLSLIGKAAFQDALLAFLTPEWE
jgi:pimeloyl-ACP methyl ester carboxylesterase